MRKHKAELLMGFIVVLVLLFVTIYGKSIEKTTTNPNGNINQTLGENIPLSVPSCH